MTTASTQRSRRGGTLLRGAALGAVVLGAGVVGLGALAGGSPAAAGAAVGVVLALGVLGLGTFTVDLVAHHLPAASLLVALLTYVLQVLVLALVFVGLTGSGALDTTLDRAWLGGAIVVVTLAWTLVQIRLATTARIPVFDVPVPTTTATPDASPLRAESQVDAGAR